MLHRQYPIVWRDLVPYQPWEVAKELSLPLPWLCATLILAHQGINSLAVFSAFYFFLTALRFSHNAFHYALGLGKRVTDILMLLQSALMLGSLHAFQYTHQQHHKHYMGEHDVEGHVARMGPFEVLLKGPLFPLAIHHHALQHAPAAKRPWIYAELLLNLGVLISVFVLLEIPALKVHYTLMILGYCLSAFFAVWLVHRQGTSAHMPSRTLRGTFKNLVFYNMFFHLEHHTYPGVPTCHLPRLAKRLDQSGLKDYERVF